tara:strand:+ start:489 stop:788 length:300 start_codon:yes stop_codon:yes gene_type:complete
MKIEVNRQLQHILQKSLERIYGVGNVGTMSQEAYDDHMNSLPKPKQSDEPEFPEPEIELVQCSRCLHKQMADISQSIAIKCEWCDEIDAAYLEGDFIDI